MKSKVVVLLLSLTLLGIDVAHAAEKTFNAIIPMVPSSFVPSEYVESYSKYVYRFIFETLFTYDENYGVSPYLVKSWSVSEDKKHYDFEIRSDVFFHNGLNLTAKDVVFSLKELKGMRSSIQAFTKSIDDIKETSKYTFTVALTRPYPFLLALLASTYASIVPNQYLNLTKPDFSKNPVGTGPFMLVSNDGKVIALKRFDKFHESKITLNNIKIFIASNEKEAVEITSSYTIHDINPVMHLYREKLLPIIKKKSYVDFSYPMFQTVFVGINQRRAHLKDKDTRDYIRDIFYQKKFLELLSSEKHIPATGFIPRGMMGYIPPEEFKLSKGEAKPLGKGKLHLKLFHYYSTDKNLEIQRYLDQTIKADSPITITAYSVAAANLKDTVVKGDFDLVILTWGAEFVHPYFYVGSFHSKSKENYLSIRDHHLDDLLDNFNATSKQEEIEYFRKLDMFLTNQKYIVPLFYPSNSYYFPPKMKGYIPSINGFDDFNFDNVTIDD